MRKTMTMLLTALLALSMATTAATAETPTLEQQCPGAVNESSPNFVPVPEGYEIVVSNDDTEEDGAASNDIILPAGTLVCVKGGPLSTGIITADGISTLKELLGEYVTVGYGNTPDVSYYMTYKKTVVDPGSWCSPGFWRNSPIQAADAAKTADLSFLPDGVSYTDVLNSPQTYGGELFNHVGDALSAAHPDVNFLGERVEDSCPLRADAAEKVGAPVFGKKK